ncbi:hypothetical protein FPL04_04190 [Xanthomonas arboricola]|nr:hypothetical protein FPL04_04190 [Xanthomonas arboricola]
MCGVGRQRGTASGVGTRRKSVPGGSVAASMPPHGPALPVLPLLIGRHYACKRLQWPKPSVTKHQ